MWATHEIHQHQGEGECRVIADSCKAEQGVERVRLVEHLQVASCLHFTTFRDSNPGAEDPGFESRLGRKNVYTMNFLGICLSLGAVDYLGIGRSTGD